MANGALRALREPLTRAWWTFRPGRRDADLEQELRLHEELAGETAGSVRCPLSLANRRTTASAASGERTSRTRKTS